MANVLLPILPGPLPGGNAYCFTNWQQTLLDFANSMQALLSGGQGFYNFGDTKPADPALQAYPWLNTNDGRWYWYDGVWLSPNPETSLNVRRLWVGVENPDAWRYDGGDGNDPSATPPTDRSGAMWEVDHLFDGRVPVGPGQVPGSSPVASIAVGGVADSLGASGEYKHQLTIPELAKHRHLPDDPLQLGFLLDVSGGGAGTNLSGVMEKAGFMTEVGGDMPHNTMQPYYGTFFLKRTARVYYVVP